MTLTDVLLPLSSYPDPTPGSAIDHALDWVALLGGSVAGLGFDVRFQNPHNALADRLVQLSETIALEEARIAGVTRMLLDHLDREARARGLACDRIHLRCLDVDIVDVVAAEARLRDLAVVPLIAGSDSGAAMAEAAVFGSGRPCLLLPAAAGRPAALDTIAIAWDFGRAAARAVHDALPLLRRASQVRVLTVAGEKVIRARHTAADLVAYLDRHGIAATIVDEVAAAGRPVGAVLDAYAAETAADLLVMGAYGHSRMREFILGGATRAVLRTASVPTLLSH